MKSRLHIHLVVMTLMLLPGAAKAQVTTQRIMENPEVGASIFRPYFFVESEPVGGVAISPSMFLILEDMGPDTSRSLSRGSRL